MLIILPSHEKILPLPDSNQFICEQNNEINGYNIRDMDKQLLYTVIAKKVTTRSHFRVLRGSKGNALAHIIQDQIENKYKITGEHDNKLAELSFDSNELNLTIVNDKYLSKSKTRAKQFEFRNNKDQIVVTIDKKLMSFHDVYHVRFVEDFPALVAALLPVCVDDIYHLGTSN